MRAYSEAVPNFLGEPISFIKGCGITVGGALNPLESEGNFDLWRLAVAEPGGSSANPRGQHLNSRDELIVPQKKKTGMS